MLSVPALNPTDGKWSIAICSNSQAALRSSKVTSSSLVVETIKALKELSMFNSVRLLWIPGYSDIPGNERQLTSLLNRQSHKISLDQSLYWVYLQRRFAVQLDCGPMHNNVSSGKPLVAVGRQKCSYIDQTKTFPLWSESTETRAKNSSWPTCRSYNT